NPCLERFGRHAPEGVIADAGYPPGLAKYDPSFERDMEVYSGQVTVRVRLARAGTERLPASGRPVTLAIVSQGCADAGLCYPPETRELQITQAADGGWSVTGKGRSEEHTSELQSREKLVCHLLHEQKK